MEIKQREEEEGHEGEVKDEETQGGMGVPRLTKLSVCASGQNNSVVWGVIHNLHYIFQKHADSP